MIFYIKIELTLIIQQIKACKNIAILHAFMRVILCFELLNGTRYTKSSMLYFKIEKAIELFDKLDN